MKFFRKLFLTMIILLTVGLSFTEYYIMSLSVESALQNQVETALDRHQLVKYAIQSDMLSAYTVEGINAQTVRKIAKNTADTMNVDLILRNNSDSKVIYASRSELTTGMEASAGEVAYRVISSDGGKYIVAVSSFEQSTYSLTLTTITDVTFIYNDADIMQQRCTVIMIIILGLGTIVSVVFSFFVTMPLKALADVGRKFTSGDYSGRVRKLTNDEIGELSETYNMMADTIQEKISDLELAVKQREDFTSAFAHELKTPMTSIIGYADTLYQKDLSEEEARAAAGFIVNEGMRLEALSFKLLELLTLKESDFLLEEIQMKDFFKDIEDTVRPVAAKKGVSLIFDIDDGYVKIEYDLFKTLILNLIDNAMKSGTSDVAVLSSTRGDEYMIAIADHGRGIPKEELKRVTEAFYMVDKARSRKEHGAGLGLALCEKIAEIHGTRLDIRSREGEGTAIRLRFKMAEDEDEE